MSQGDSTAGAHPLGKLVSNHLTHVVPYRRTASPTSPLTAQRKRFAAPAIRLDANECAFPLPEGAKSLFAQVVEQFDLSRYPDPRCTQLAELLSKRDGGTAADYVFGAGSDEVITLLIQTFSKPWTTQPKARVLTVTPSFVMYQLSTLASGLHPVLVPLTESFHLDIPAMREAIEDFRPNVIFLASPNNPTGASFAEADLHAVAEASRDALLVLDGAYEPFADSGLHHFADTYPHVAVLGTVSKIGFAGLRLGWCRLPAGLAEHVHKVRQPFNVGSLSQRLAELVITDLAEVVNDRVKWVRQERQRVGKRLERIPRCFPYPSHANFILFRTTAEPEKLATTLLSEGIAIKNLDPVGGLLRNHLRMTIGTPEENETVLAALEQHLTS